MKITEISKLLGVRWGKMDEEQKRPFQDKADEDKARFAERISPHVFDSLQFKPSILLGCRGA